MKNKIILLFFLFSCFFGFSQSISNRSSDVITVQDGNLFAKNSFRPAVFQDTTAGTIALDSCGKLIFTYSDNSYWIRACSPKRWVRLLKEGEAENISNAALTADGNYAQNWNSKQLRIDSIAGSLFFRGGGIGNTGTRRKEFSISWPGNSFADQFDAYTMWSAIRKADNSADSLRLGLLSGGTGVLSMGGYDVANSSNNTFISYSSTAGLININAKDSIWIKGAVPAATADSILGVVYRSSPGISKIVKIPIPVSSGAVNNTNVGSSFRWLNEGTQEIKTVANSNTILWDSTSTANTLTAKADTSVLATQYDLTQVTPSSTLVSDLGRLPQIKVYMPANGTNASAAFSASYPVSSVDTAYYAFTASGVGNENGGWLAAGTSGDSAQVTAPYWILLGNSIMEGHPGRHGRLHPLVGGVAQNTFIYNYPDSVGQLSYHLRALTNMRWYNHGIGGQTTVQLRQRFIRDVAADTVPNMNDGRGNRTLNQRPQGVIIEGGINDIFNGVDASVTKANLEWMAAECQARNIRCVMLNIPGDAAANQSQLRLIASMNEWFESGVFEQYNACVVDFNAWWNNPTYGGDNIHPTSLIVDDIHPSMVGYDSLANYIFRSARLPVLTRAIFINELDPGGFTGYSRPANITVNGDAYSLTNATDSIDITAFVPDSVWIKVISSTNVTGTTYTGFSHILWKQDNNVNDSTLYTRRTFYNNSVSYPSLSGADIIAAKPSNNLLAFRIRMNDLNETFRALTSGGGGTFIFNGLSNTTALNNATVSIYNTGTGLGMNGNIKASGTAHQFGVLEVNQNTTAGTTGYGISAANTASSLSFIGTAQQGKDLIRFTTWNGANSNLGTAPVNLLNITGAGFGNSTATNQVGHAISIVPTINNTVGDAGSEITGIYYNPIRTSLTNTRHVGIFMRSGNNYFNVAGTDSTCFGCDSASNILAKFRVNGSFRLDNVLEPPSTYTVLVHGLTDSIVYQIPSTSLSLTTSTITGTTTGNDATAGNIGEYVESNITSGSAVSLTNNTEANITSISLTAGDWDVGGITNFAITGATTTNFRSGSNSTSATLGGDNTYIHVPIIATGLTEQLGGVIPTRRYSLSGTTTIYLVGRAVFSAGAVDGYGRISARRVR